MKGNARGGGLMVAPQRLQVTYLGDRYRLEAWVWNPPLSRLLTLMLLPEELPLESGGFLGAIPRRRTRKQVNQLLQDLGQPPIPQA